MTVPYNVIYATQPFDIHPGQSTFFDVQIVDGNGNPVLASGYSIYLYLGSPGGTIVDMQQTNAQGIASFSESPLAGTYQYYARDEEDEGFGESTLSNSFICAQYLQNDPCPVKFVLEPVNTPFGQAVAVTVQCVDENGDPIALANKNIYLYYGACGGYYVANAQSDQNGLASFPAVMLQPGTYNLYARDEETMANSLCDESDEFVISPASSIGDGAREQVVVV